MRSVVVAGVVLFLQELGCAGPSRIEPSVCGNAVLEPGEDCDTYSDPSLGEATACVACRYVCDAPERRCPTSWGCSPDEICRFPSGRWQSVGLVDDSARLVRVGEVDGDGHADLFGVGSLGVWARSGGPDLRFSERFGLPGNPVFGLPAIQDLTGDGQLDVVIPVAGAFFVIAGSARGFDTMAQATIEPNPPFSDGLALLPLVTDPGEPFDDVLAMFANGTVSALALVTNALVLEAFYGFPTYHTAAEIRALAAGNIDPGPESGDDVAIAFAGDPRVFIFHTGRRAGVRYLEEGGEVPIPEPIAEGLDVALVDLDGDGALDLLVPAGTGVAVAWGDGLGDFSAAAEEPRFAGLGWPLAIGDLDADGVLDYVYPDGIYLDRDGTLINRGAALFPAISRAAIADYNRDGVNDVALALDELPRLHVVLGSDLGYFSNAITFSLDAPVTIVRSGDFDGDRADDVLFVQRSPLGDSLSVAFGKTTLPFDEPTLMGRFETIQDMRTALLTVAGFAFDITTDLLVMSSRTGAPSDILGIYVVFGTSTRRMASGFNLGFESRAVFVGPFSPEGDANADVVAITAPVTGNPMAEINGSTMQLIHGRGDARFHDSDRRYLHSAVIEGGILDPHPGCTLWASGDVNGDGRDDLVGVGICAGSALYVASIGGDDTAPSLVETVEPITERTAPASLTLGDVDGDGAADAVVTWAEGLAVYWNEGGAFAATRAAVLPALLDEPWRGAALVNADGDQASELAVVSPAGVRIVEISGRVPSLGPANVAEGGEGIWVGDVDANQLDDLIVARGDRVEILVAVPHDE